ncbi:MAG TPA: hypothetical protein VHZ95_02935 [Polyangiales bacterium]|jgi:hypothetical protein|nr:hypothetical protein [Polyangiales bacterium]
MQTETASTTNPTPSAKPTQGQTRIPVSYIWFRDQLDLPGGNAIQTEIACGRHGKPGRQFFVAHFVPAHQVIEMEFYRNAETEPEPLDSIPVAFVKRMRYAKLTK